MRRLELSEIHDHPRFPAFLRDLVTDGLQALWAFANTYQPIVPRLRAAMELAGTREVLDLCSGSGGPWLRLVENSDGGEQLPAQVRLTDKYPNLTAFERARAGSERIEFESRPVDAAAVPAELAGFRTMFSSFHHFGPDEARRLLVDAAECRRGVAIFEAARMAPRTILTIFAVPLLTLWLAPAIRPFRWSRLLWTYLIPVVPFVLWYDGLLSCLRAYSHAELDAMAKELARDGYEWWRGEERSGWLPVTYLIGYPTRV